MYSFGGFSESPTHTNWKQPITLIRETDNLRKGRIAYAQKNKPRELTLPLPRKYEAPEFGRLLPKRSACLRSACKPTYAVKPNKLRMINLTLQKGTVEACEADIRSGRVLHPMHMWGLRPHASTPRQSRQVAERKMYLDSNRRPYVPAQSD